MSVRLLAWPGLGWSGVLNGELMRRARECCDVFVTLDRNIEFQRNIFALPFGVILSCVRFPIE